MSSLFAYGSASESEGSGSDSEQNERAVARPVMGLEDSSSDEEKRQILTQKDKRFGAMQRTTSRIRSGQRKGDWAVAYEEYKLLRKQMDKSRKVIRQEGGVPDFVLRSFVRLREAVEETKQRSKAAREEGKEEKMDRIQSRALNSLTQVMRKTCKEFAAPIEALRKSGGLEVEDGGDEEEDSDGSDQDSNPLAAQDLVQGGDGDDGDGFSSGYSSGYGDDDDASDGSEIDESRGPKGYTHDFWLLKEDSKTGNEGAARKKKPQRSQKPRPQKPSGEPKPKRPEKKMDAQALIKRIETLEGLRARQTDQEEREAYCYNLQRLIPIAREPSTKLKIQTLLLTALFDLHVNATRAMPAELWKKCADQIDSILNTLQSDPNLRLCEDEDRDENFAEREIDREEREKPESERATKTRASKPAPEGPVYILGSLYAWVSRLQTTFRNTLKNTNPHEAEYVTRLRDRTILLKLVRRGTDYYRRTGKTNFLAILNLLHLQQVYYTYDKARDAFVPPTEAGAPVAYKMSPSPVFGRGAENDPVEALAYEIQNAAPSAFERKEDEARIKASAVLCLIYYFATHNRFTEARNLLLMTHLQDVVHTSDYGVRILYNRAVAALGLCAFRNGFYGGAKDCLTEFYKNYDRGNRFKELLAQGVTSSRYNDRNPEKERRERARELPYHMHINDDMLVAVHHMSAMFFEIPNILRYGDSKKRSLNRYFRKDYDNWRRLVFKPPPESTRNIIVCAAGALAEGDWEKSFKYICELRMWSVMPHAEAVRARLKRQIQLTALRAYMLVYGSQFISIDVKRLCGMFSISRSDLRQCISKMMLRNELLGAWDEPTDSIIMQNEEQTMLQKAMLAFADKVVQHVEVNEKLVDLRSLRYQEQRAQREGKAGSASQGKRSWGKQHYSRKGQMSKTSRH